MPAASRDARSGAPRLDSLILFREKLKKTPKKSVLRTHQVTSLFVDGQAREAQKGIT